MTLRQTQGPEGPHAPAPALSDTSRAEASATRAAGVANGRSSDPAPAPSDTSPAGASATRSAGVANGRFSAPEAAPSDTSPAGAPAAAPRDTSAPGPDAHRAITVDELDLAAEITGESDAAASAAVAEYALWLGDDALILSQQLGEWIAHAPELEEDVALANIALDLLGHARSLLRYAGTADGRSEDDLAYFRDEPEFRSAWLFEQPGGDFAQTIARQLAASAYLFELYSALRSSKDATLAAVAEKSVKEVDYHRDHAIQWTLRLAGGTDESRRRMIRAVTDIWPYVEELFRDEPLIDELEGIAVRPSTLREGFDTVIDEVFAEAELALPQAAPSAGGGRRGIHFPALGRILAEMQVLARQHPGATW